MAVPFVTIATVLPMLVYCARLLRILADREADPGDAWRVDVAQDLLRVDRQRRHGADLAAAVTVEHAVRMADEACDRQRVDPVVEAAVRLLVHFERDFPERAALLAAQGLQVVDREAGIGDDEQHLGEAPGLVHGLDHQDFRNLHALPRRPAAMSAAW